MKLTKILPLLAAIFVLGTAAACTSGTDNAVDGSVGSTSDSTAAIANNQPTETNDSKKQSPRPATKTDTMSVEGEKTEVNLKLYDELINAFTTYYPENDFLPEAVNSGEEKDAVFYYNIDGTKNKDVYVSVSFPKGATNLEELENLVTGSGGLFQNNQWKVVERVEEVPYSWAKEKIVFEQSTDSQNITGEVYLGESNGKVFYVITHYPAEFGDGFAPRANLILNNLQVSS